MKIGIAGPIQTKPLLSFLDNGEISNAPKGLGGTIISHLVKGILDAGNNVSVYTLDQNVESPIILHGSNLTLYYGPYRTRKRMRDFFLHERKNIKDFILSDNPDIVHAHWTYEFALGALATGKPSCITVHDWPFTILRYKPDPYRFGRLLMAIVTFLKGYHFSAVSPYIQGCMKKYLRKDVPVISNLLDESLYFKGERHLNSHYPVIVSVNDGFSKRKNVKSLLLAFMLIRIKLPSCRLKLIGHGFEINGEANNWCDINLISNGIDFLGSIPNHEVLNIFESSDLLIHPSLEESFGMTLLEAMANKTPVIGGDKSGAVPWLLDYGRAGVLTDITSPEHIATEAIQLLSNDGVWNNFSYMGYRYAWNNFRSSIIVNRYLNNYKRILSNTSC